MRQTSAESREIDLMMRQWKPAKQTPARSSGWVKGKLSDVAATVRAGSGLPLLGAFLVGAGLAGSAAAQTMAAPVPLVQTRTELSVAARPALAQSGGRSVMVFTAHVTDAAGRSLGSESGAVSFEIEPALASRGTSSETSPGKSLGSALVDENGDATLPVTSLPASVAGGSSTLAVHAVYHPSAESTASSVSTAAVIEADATGVPDFSITANPSTLSVTAGQFATTALTITPINGFSEQVTLSCSALPTQVTCIFSPVIESTAQGAFTSTLQIQTQTANNAAALKGSRKGLGSRVALAWMLPGVLALVGFASRRRRALPGLLSACLLLLLLAGGLAGTAALSGCSTRYGYNHHPPSVATGTPVGTYTLSIDASGNDGSAVTEHDIPVVLQVK